MRRYHVTVSGKRTTVSLDNIVSDLLALRLGLVPRSAEATAAVGRWLQQQIDSKPNSWWRNRQRASRSPHPTSRVSQWAAEAVIKAVADPELMDLRRGWLGVDG